MRCSPASWTWLRLLALFHVLGRASAFTPAASKSRERSGVSEATAVGVHCSRTDAAAISCCRGGRPLRCEERGRTGLFMQKSYREESEVRQGHSLCVPPQVGSMFNVCSATCSCVERMLRTLLLNCKRTHSSEQCPRLRRAKAIR